MKTLQHVVFGLEELAGADQHHAAQRLPSTTAGGTLLNAWANARGVPLNRYTSPCQGKGGALNRALRAAQGEILAFTDDDCRGQVCSAMGLEGDGTARQAEREGEAGAGATRWRRHGLSLASVRLAMSEIRPKRPAKVPDRLIAADGLVAGDSEEDDEEEEDDIEQDEEEDTEDGGDSYSE